MSEWQIDSSETIQLDETPAEFAVKLVGGDLRVTATDGASSIDVTNVVGPEVRISMTDGRLEVCQEEPSFSRFGVSRVSCSVSVSIPATCRVQVETVSASVLASGMGAEFELSTVSGEATLESLGGRVEVATVSGDVASRGQSGKFRGKTVSGGMTLDAFGGSSVRLNSVSGEIVADLKQAEPDGSTEVETISGAVLLRLAGSPSQRVKVTSVSGRLNSAFPELRSDSAPGSRSLKGSLGEGRGKLHVTTVSGTVSLLGGESA